MDAKTTEEHIHELESIRKQINLWRTGSALVIVVTMAVCLGLLYSDAKALSQPGPKQEVFVDTLKTNLDEGVVPRLRETASRTVSEMQPIIQKELTDLNKRVPDVTKAAVTQLQELQKSLPETATKTLTDTFGKALEGKDAEIRKMYPDATEDQVKTLFTNLLKVTNDKSVQIANTMLQPHVTELQGIYDNLQKIAKTEPNTGNNADDWQLGLAVFDVVRDDMKGLTLPTGDAKKAIVDAANKLSEAAKKVDDTAQKVANEAKKQ